MGAALGKSLGYAAIAAGLLLNGLNVAGLLRPISEHSFGQGLATHKTNLDRPSYEASLDALSQIDQSLPVEEQFSAVNRIMASRIVHYWPKSHQIDTEVMHSPFENWVMATAQRARAAARKPAKAEIARIGRRDHKRIMAKGVGLCGMAALAVVDYLNAQGHTAKLLPLGNHVVAYASVDGRHFILDPDKAVFIADVPEPPERSIPKIVQAYSEAGYQPKKLAQLQRQHEQAPMKLFPADRFQKRWRRTLMATEILKWLLPAALIVLGAGLIWRGRHRIARAGTGPKA